MHAEADEMRAELVSEHPGLMRPELVGVYRDVSRAVALIPDGLDWMVAAHEMALYAQRGGLLFSLRGDALSSSVVLASRWLDPDRLEVSLEWDEPQPSEDVSAILRPSKWSFRHEGIDAEPWQQIEGVVWFDHTGVERCDRRELFARALARFAGWNAFE
jgi:hypothetical protein